MVKAALNGLIRYFRYCLAAASVIYLAVLAVLYIVGGGVAALIEKSDADFFNTVFAYFAESFENISWQAVFRQDFFKDFFKGLPDIFADAPESATRSVLVRLAASGAFVVASVKLAGWLARRYMRKELKAADTVKGFFTFLIRTAGSIAGWAVFFVVSAVWIYAIFLLPVLSFLIGIVRNLIETKLIYFKKSPLKSILNLKNFLLLGLATLLLHAIALAVAVVLYFTAGIFFAALIGIPLFVYTGAVADVVCVRHMRHKLGMTPPALCQCVPPASNADKTLSCNADKAPSSAPTVT
ncbi:MAG: hypothetical protein LBT55_04855 [Clostridiaceae bacterium]|nr:hypothetical protein [Clostridiaceae bacterium]